MKKSLDESLSMNETLVKGFAYIILDLILLRPS